MNNKLIYDNYRKQLINLHGLTIIIVAIAELVAYSLLISKGKCSLSPYSSYLWLKVILPIAINASGYMTAVFINRHSIFSYGTKNSAVVNISLITAASISIFHREFIASFSAFIFPIFLSGIFNDKKQLNKSLIISLFFLILHLFLAKAETYTDLESVINYIAYFGIIVVAYLFGCISIDFYNLNFFIIENQANTNNRLRNKIKHDSLTGLYNRDTMFSEIKKSIEEYSLNHIPFCFAMVDIDDFKRINDLYGHNKGDAVLKKMSKVLTDICDKNDCICRFGGDEFAIIFNNKNINDANTILKRIICEFSHTSYAFTDKEITCSCGIAEYNEKMSASDLFNKADKNMYNAKNGGKNQIYCEQK